VGGVGEALEAVVVEVAAPAGVGERAEVAAPAEGVERAEVEAEQAPAVVTAEAEAEVLRQSGPEALETRGLPETPRPASAWHRRGHSPSAGRHPCLSSG
jgi:hypothetical protein